jgi:hypothetical protein
MKVWFAVVDTFLGIKGDEDILIDMDRIGAWRLYVASVGTPIPGRNANLPRARPKKCLTRDKLKDSCQSAIQ